MLIIIIWQQNNQCNLMGKYILSGGPETLPLLYCLHYLQIQSVLCHLFWFFANYGAKKLKRKLSPSDSEAILTNFGSFFVKLCLLS